MGVYRREEESEYWYFSFKIPGMKRLRVRSNVPVMLEGRVSKSNKDLAKKIYALPDFPGSLKKFKNETYSSAYFLAWWMSGKRVSFKGIKYLLISFFYHPERYFLLFENRAARLARRVAKKIWSSTSRK